MNQILSIAQRGVGAMVNLVGVALSAVALLMAAQAEDSLPTAPALQAIYDNVLLGNSYASVAACERLQQQVKAPSFPAVSALIPDFAELVTSWKRVQVTIDVLMDISDEAADTHFYLDMYHSGNEDVEAALKRIADNAAGSDVAKAMFKNSTKTIDALEILLYSDDEMTPRRQQMIKVATDNVCRRLTDIAKAYEAAEAAYFAHPEKSAALLLNALAQNTFKTKDWRIGDPVGLSRKHEGDPDPQRAEYYRSGLSLVAIDAILATHAQLIAADQQPNFATIAIEQGAAEAVAAAQTELSAAQTALRSLPSDRELVLTPAVETLFEALDGLQTAYYQNLMDSLSLMAKILEADGD